MTWIAPDTAAVQTYLGPDTSWTTPEVTSALASETAAQLCAIKLPTQVDPLVDEDYPADIAEALCRRVAHNLAVRALPLGVQASITDGAVATNVVAGTDAEVRRLERPYRRVVIA